MRSRFLVGLALTTAAAGWLIFENSAALAGAVSLASADWAYFGGTLGSTQYSPLSQIDKSNVQLLKPAWWYDTGEETTTAAPLVADGVMYVVKHGTGVAALDPATGRELWFAPGVMDHQRGLSYWRSADGGESRIFVSKDQHLRAIDAQTGRPIAAFGTDGSVDLRIGLGRDLEKIGSIEPISPGKVVGDVIILGSNPGEGYGAPPGDIRAFNVRSGKLLWQFHTIPHPGEPGYETWPADGWKTSGAANNWGGMAIDAERGIAYLGLGAPTYDFWGGDRKGANLYGDSLIALDVATGRLLWHHQLVHHDLWDYDVDVSPVLMQVRRGGKMINAVVQATKQGFVFVFDRVTGKPVYPIEERAVPASEMPDDKAAPTQPFSTLPPFVKQTLSVDDLDPNLPPVELAEFTARIKAARNEGLFTPAGTRETVEMPGNHGGTNWGMAAGEPNSGRFYVTGYNLPALLKLVKMDAEPPYELSTPFERGEARYKNNCAVCHGDTLAGQSGIPALTGVVSRLGADGTFKVIREGRETMPSFAGSLDPAAIHDVVAYLNDPSAKPAATSAAPAHGATGVNVTGAGKARWYSSYGYLFSKSTALPAIKAPWTTITAYDLNKGKILWQVPLGGEPGYPAAATGVSRSKGGLVVTAGGLVFAGSSDDRKIHAYDRDTGKLLWEYVLPSPAQGVPAIYAVNGREYIAVPAAYYYKSGTGPFGPMRGAPGHNGYMAFALPKQP
jgi:quinoprotein glucose dehydrogenase